MQDKAIFIDLDDTLITTRSGKKYPIHSEDWKFLPETLEAIKYYYKHGYMIVIVSNQLGIDEGYVVEKAFVAKMERICKVLEKSLKLAPQSIRYNYNNTSNYYTMPNPGMIFELAIDYELNTHNSIILGSNSDTGKLAKNLGMTYLSIVDIINVDWDNR